MEPKSFTEWYGNWGGVGITVVLISLFTEMFAFKPAVTLYVLIVGVGIVRLKVVELSRLSCEIEDIVRRKLHGNYTH